jgi:uncharacterized damage-inducible protein DinB
MNDMDSEIGEGINYYFASFIRAGGLMGTLRAEAHSADEFVEELLRREPRIERLEELVRLGPPDLDASQLASVNMQLPVAQYNHELERRRAEADATRGDAPGWDATTPLLTLLDGWNGYQQSLLDAVRPLTPEQATWRPGPDRRSAGELAAHIVAGRITWFQRMAAPGSADLFGRIIEEGGEETIAKDPAALGRWLEASWMMVEDRLRQWTVAELGETYRDEDEGQVWAVSRQWTIWRVMSHDIHHGGELALTLGLQGISLPELGDQGGHIIIPPLAEE